MKRNMKEPASCISSKNHYQLLILGIIEDTRSSRKIAKNATENVVHLYLAGLLKTGFQSN